MLWKPGSACGKPFPGGSGLLGQLGLCGAGLQLASSQHGAGRAGIGAVEEWTSN